MSLRRQGRRVGALAFPACTARLDVAERHVMNVRVPAFRFSLEGSLVAYGLADTNRDLDRAMGDLAENTIKYKTAAQLLSAKLKSLKNVIQGGK